MQTRRAKGLDMRARYIRVEPPRKNSAYAISEFQIFCEEPTIWPPILTVGDSRRDRTLTGDEWTFQIVLNGHRIGRLRSELT